MTAFSTLAKLISILCLVLLVSGCRYWSLYRFADQFCDYDAHIEVILNQHSTQIVFSDPVLPAPVFDRYFKAEPHQTSETDARTIHHYQLASQYDTLQRHYALQVDYSRHSRQPLLAEASIGPALSAVFQPAFVEKILRSSCTDDIDLSLSEAMVRFVLLPIEESTMPTLQQMTKLFGPGLPSANTQIQQRDYHLDFETKPGPHSNSKMTTQNKPIFLRFTFSEQGTVTAITVDYLNYAMQLDFLAGTGYLHVIRGENIKGEIGRGGSQ